MKLQKKTHVIKKVIPGSIAEELEIEAGDRLLAIDGTEIEDIFDYQFLIQDTYIEALVEKPDGEQWLLEVEKDFDEDLGIEFENGLMDEYRSCRNKCIFCFIDQMPPGMRETLYFKDDDSRLSFLQGNYVTLTNMSDTDIDRICRYHLSPINISFHTMNPQLRCKMLNNRFAGDALKKVDTLYEAGIRMNGQIVLCKGVNDGAELDYSIRQLMKYMPVLESVSVVPVGLTRFREGLYPLEPFDREDAIAVIDMIEKYQQECYAKSGLHFIHASDEWYILADREMPEEERYDGYLQLENGVGMLRLLLNEFAESMALRQKADLQGKSNVQVKSGVQDRPDLQSKPGVQDRPDLQSKSGVQDRPDLQSKSGVQDRPDLQSKPDMQDRPDLQSKPGMQDWPDLQSKSGMQDRSGMQSKPGKSGLQDISYREELSIATGKLPFPYIRRMAERMMAVYPGLNIHVYPITNYFFGERITVSGLITGQDLLRQLKGKPLGSRLLLPENILRSGEDVFLDDMRVGELEKALQVPINIVKSSGNDFVKTILGE